MPTAEEYESAGLLTGIVTSHDDRVALLDWLAEEGFSVADMTAAHAEGQLANLALNRVLLPGEPCTLEEIAAASEADVATLTALLRVVGINPDTVPLTHGNLDPLLGEFGSDAQLTSEAEILHFGRVVGSSIARIAEAATALFRIDVEGPMKATAPSELAYAQMALMSVTTLNSFAESMSALLRMHVYDAGARVRAARPGDDTDLVKMAIGFVDLVGFTPLSSSTSTRELLDLLVAFESRAYDLVTEHGGRVVKLIGDEVMFAAADPADACRIAQRMFDELAERTDLAPRGGIAYGEVLSHGGDYYGAIVNLASRMADTAVPGEVLLTAEVAREVPDGFRAVAAGRRALKGFDQPVTLSSLERLG